MDKTFDMVSYAVVDSLVLHSGYSSLRLESFLFTEEAFRDIASKLNPDGIFVMLGFGHLILLAILFYVFSALLHPRLTAAAPVSTTAMA